MATAGGGAAGVSRSRGAAAVGRNRGPQPWAATVSRKLVGRWAGGLVGSWTFFMSETKRKAERPGPKRSCHGCLPKNLRKKRKNCCRNQFDQLGENNWQKIPLSLLTKSQQGISNWFLPVIFHFHRRVLRFCYQQCSDALF